jgi:MoxR-like ATPase
MMIPETPMATPQGDEYREQIRRFRETHERIRAQVRRVIVGQDEIIEQLLLTLWGTFSAGPIFTHVLLADEVNRTPPKTQAALLEAMQEGSCTVRGTTYTLERPFFVLATQNPIELEGTYPLPEAQLDRFLFNVVLDYLGAVEEVQVVARNTSEELPVVEACTTAEEIMVFRRLVKQVLLSDNAVRYAVDLLRATRPHEESAPEVVKKYVKYGASVRATQFLVLAAKARALTRGRYHVATEDLQALVRPVLRHRLLTNFHAESDGITTDEILGRLVAGFRPAVD